MLKTVIISKTVISGIIGWIYKYTLHFSGIMIGERMQRQQIISFDNQIVFLLIKRNNPIIYRCVVLCSLIIAKAFDIYKHFLVKKTVNLVFLDNLIQEGIIVAFFVILLGHGSSKHTIFERKI